MCLRMFAWTPVLVLAVGCWVSVYGMPMPTPASDMMDMEEIEDYFVKYNYMGRNMPDEEIADMYQNNKPMAFRKAAEIFQKRYSQFGLQVNGELDNPTMELMKRPRCGMPDINTMEDMMEMKRKKRYLVSGSKWSMTDLTYRISAYTPDMSRSDVDKEIRRAFAVWENVTSLRFSIYNPAVHDSLDIDIQFVQPLQDHGDGFPFDGPGGTLAHAFFPQSGQIGGDSHFDEAELWTLDTSDGTNLFQVAAHEFGHALGLGHSMDPEALMAPFYPGYKPTFTLPTDDINGIQAIYGGRTKTTTTTEAPTQPPTMHPSAPDVCRQSSFDAISTIRHSRNVLKTYGFQGDKYFLLNERGGIAAGYPRRISEGWPGLPNNIDAALFWDETVDRRNQKTLPAATFVFKGNHYWRVEDMTVVSGPKPVSDWGIPGHIDAAFVWKTNGKTYFFKGDQYYRYTEDHGVDVNYPRHINAWRGLPRTGIDAVINLRGRTYFFKGTNYYRFNDSRVKVDHGYPRKNGDDWLGCYRNAPISNPHRGPQRGGHRRYPSRFS